MPTAFPTGYDTFEDAAELELHDLDGTPRPGAPGGTLDIAPHSDQHGDLGDALEALEARVGIDGETDPASHEARLDALEGAPSGGVQSVNGDAGPDVVLDASDIDVTPAGGISATDVQGALGELDTEKAAAVHVHDAGDITTGTIDDARIPAAITRDVELAAALASYQPLDSDLSAIAALATTAFGRGLLTLANAAALISAAGLDPDVATLALPANTTISAYGATLVDDADAATARTTLGLGSAATHAATDFDAAGTAAAGDAAEAIARDAAISAAIAAFVNSAPGTLDTLKELADALGDDPNFATTVTSALAGKQPLDTELTALAALASAANKLPYFTGSGTAALADLTAFARTLLDDADATTMRATLGLGTAATAAASDFQPVDSDLTAIAALATTAFGRSFLDRADAAAARTLIGTVIGTDVEAHDATLTALAAVVTGANKLIYATAADTFTTTDLSAFGRSLIDDADASAARTTLALVIGTDVEAHDSDLTDIAALTPTNDDILQRKAGHWTNRSVAQYKTDLAIATADISDYATATDERARDAVGAALVPVVPIAIAVDDSANTITVDYQATVQSKAATFTAVAGFVYKCDASGGAFSANLPAAASNTGKAITIIKTDTSTNAVTLDGNSAETINGAATVAIITQYVAVTIVSDGTNWLIT